MINLIYPITISLLIQYPMKLPTLLIQCYSSRNGDDEDKGTEQVDENKTENHIYPMSKRNFDVIHHTTEIDNENSFKATVLNTSVRHDTFNEEHDKSNQVREQMQLHKVLKAGQNIVFASSTSHLGLLEIKLEPLEEGTEIDSTSRKNVNDRNRNISHTVDSRNSRNGDNKDIGSAIETAWSTPTSILQSVAYYSGLSFLSPTSPISSPSPLSSKEVNDKSNSSFSPPSMSKMKIPIPITTSDPDVFKRPVASSSVLNSPTITKVYSLPRHTDSSTIETTPTTTISAYTSATNQSTNTIDLRTNQSADNSCSISKHTSSHGKSDFFQSNCKECESQKSAPSLSNTSSTSSSTNSNTIDSIRSFLPLDIVDIALSSGGSLWLELPVKEEELMISRDMDISHELWAKNETLKWLPFLKRMNPSILR